MFIDPVTLIDQTIDNLQQLTELFSDDLDERVHDPERMTPEARTSKDAAHAIGLLMPHLKLAMIKLQSARSTHVPPSIPMQRVCANYNDS
jgi:hypothetical protein